MKTTMISKLQDFSSCGDYPLQTFHHLLYDSLMPWLPTFNNELVFRLMLGDIISDRRPDFLLLHKAFNKRRISLHHRLTNEWQTFAKIDLSPATTDLLTAFSISSTSSLKVNFFNILIFWSMPHSLSMLDYLVNEASEPLKKYHVSLWLKTVADLRHRAHGLYTGVSTDDAVILYLSDVALSILERRIMSQYTGFCPPVLLISSLNVLKPTREMMEMEEGLLVYTAKLHKTYAAVPRPENTGKPGGLRDKGKMDEADEKTKLLHESPTPELKNPPTPKSDIPSAPASTHQNNGFLNSAQAMYMLGIGKTKLAELRNKGELPFSRIGRKILFQRSDIEAFKKQSKVEKNILK
jgi:excisionase family DNA binding protein